jgi:putative membrane protein
MLAAVACATTPDPDTDVTAQGGATAGTPAAGGTPATVAAGGSTTGGSASGGMGVPGGATGGTTGTTDATGTPTSGTPATGSAGAGGAGAADASGAASGRNLSAGGAPDRPESPDEMFTDTKIAAVASASNQDEIQTSQVAVERAQDAQVKAYAQRMITEHTQLEQQQQQLLQQKGLAPQENALSLQLKRNLQPTLDSLRAKSGHDFDTEYVLHQISAHGTTLKTLDTSLIPQARDAEMKAMLSQRVRPAVAQHLAEAKRLHDALAKHM